MKMYVIGLYFLCMPFLLQAQSKDSNKTMITSQYAQDKLLRHVVLFKFKEDTSPEQLAKIIEAFEALPNKIPQIKAFEWGLNNSPEGLNKGFTHCFLLSFASEEDRDAYLPHPDHKAFGNIAGPSIEDVLVVDFWE